MKEKVNYDELYYLVNEKNEEAEALLFGEVESYLGWICFSQSNDFLRKEDILSFGWQGYIEAFKGYDENNSTTFKSFLQHCIKRRLIDVQRNRNKRSLKGLMSGLLMSEEKVQYAVEARNTSSINHSRIGFEFFWKELTNEEEQLFMKHLEGENVATLAKRFETTESVIYKRLRVVKDKLSTNLIENN